MSVTVKQASSGRRAQRGEPGIQGRAISRRLVGYGTESRMTIRGIPRYPLDFPATSHRSGASIVPQRRPEAIRCTNRCPQVRPSSARGLAGGAARLPVIEGR